MTKKKATPSVLDTVVPVSDTGIDPAADTAPLPTSLDPIWTQYVLGLMLEDEVYDGAPTVDGLRRVCEIVLGSVVESVSEVPSAPSAMNGGTATVIHHLVIECKDGVVRRFSGVADVNAQNTDPEFARFASATAETRAEGRALRRALRLKKICAAEELTTIPINDVSPDAKISDHQITAMTYLCSKLDINIWKYLNAGKDKYETVASIPYSVAQAMMGHLNVFQQDKSKIQPELRGYDANWKSKVA